MALKPSIVDQIINAVDSWKCVNFWYFKRLNCYEFRTNESRINDRQFHNFAFVDIRFFVDPKYTNSDKWISIVFLKYSSSWIPLNTSPIKRLSLEMTFVTICDLSGFDGTWSLNVRFKSRLFEWPKQERKIKRRIFFFSSSI